MKRRLLLSLWLVVALAACGRTAPVGPHEPRPDETVTTGTGGGSGTGGGNGQITAGLCEGPEQTCHHGFHCEAGSCVLNGGEGQIQVTLQWQNDPRTPDDLDLHLLEPRPGGAGPCEIYYGGDFFGLSTCGALGRLDLDANAACIDSDPSGGPGSDTENIIYPADQPAPHGHYVVRVDHWGECSGGRDVPFVVTVRNGGVVTRTPGRFSAADTDQGSAGAGVMVVEFNVP